MAPAGGSGRRRRRRRPVRADRVGLVVDDDEAVGRLVEQVDEALDGRRSPTGAATYSSRQCRPLHGLAHGVGRRARRGRARSTSSAAGSTPSAAAWAAGDGRRGPSPVARSTDCSVACTARPIAVPARPAPRRAARSGSGSSSPLSPPTWPAIAVAARTGTAAQRRRCSCGPVARPTRGRRRGGGGVGARRRRRTAVARSQGERRVAEPPPQSGRVRAALGRAARPPASGRPGLWCSADDQVVAGAGGGDVEQPHAARGASISCSCVGEGVEAAVWKLPDLDLGRARLRHSTAAAGCRRRWPPVEAARGHDRELEALGAVDGEDAHGVVVGLGQHGLAARGRRRRPGARPRRGTPAGWRRRPPRTPGPGRARSAAAATGRAAGGGRRPARRPQLAHDPLDQARRRRPTTARACEVGQRPQPGHHRMVAAPATRGRRTGTSHRPPAWR